MWYICFTFLRFFYVICHKYYIVLCILVEYCINSYIVSHSVCYVVKSSGIMWWSYYGIVHVLEEWDVRRIDSEKKRKYKVGKDS